MGKYSGFTYGSGVLYGAVTVVTTIDPDSGPSDGGVDFALIGEGFDPRVWDDEFTNAVLNPLLWTDISTVPGLVATASPNLYMNTSAVAGRTAGVASIKTWNNCQGEIRVLLPRVAAYPAGDVTAISLTLYVDANNYCSNYITLGSDGAYTLHCVVHAGGVDTETYSQTVTRGTSVLRILRWGKYVYFLFNGVVVFSTTNFVTTAALFRIYTTNGAQAYDTSVYVEWFFWRTYVAFDNQIVHSPTVVSDTRLRGFTPPSVNSLSVDAAYAGLVDLSVVGATSVTYTDSYEYYFVDRMKAMNVPQHDVVLSIINDPQLMTSDTSDKGL